MNYMIFLSVLCNFVVLSASQDPDNSFLSSSGKFSKKSVLVPLPIHDVSQRLGNIEEQIRMLRTSVNGLRAELGVIAARQETAIEIIGSLVRSNNFITEWIKKMQDEKALQSSQQASQSTE